MKSRHKTKKVKRRRKHGHRDRSPSGPEPSSAASRDGWPLALKARPDLSLESDNNSFVQTRARFGEEDKNGIYQIFMRGAADPSGRIPRAIKLEAFASGMTLDILRSAEENGRLQLAVWRDDRNFRTKSAVPGASCKALTAYGLCLDFSKPRFPSAVIKCGVLSAAVDNGAQDQKASSSAANMPTTKNTTPLELDADRRIVLITNLDCYGIFAVVWTASAHQVPALRNALFHHLDFNASLEMSVSMESFPAFELAFHLPFFVLKGAGPNQGDSRISDSKKTLRRSYLVPSFDGSGSESLHEAHISCTVTGSDEIRWTAYAFVDTYYFSAIDEDREDATEHEADAHEDDRGDATEDDDGDLHVHTMQPDALTYGVEDAGRPIWNPRIYFLAVFAPRLQQVRREWENVVMNFTERIRAFEEALDHEMAESTPFQSSNKQRNPLNIHDSLAWVLKTKHLTDMLLKVLSGTIKNYEPFCSQNLACEDGSLRFPKGHRLLGEVYKTFEILRQLEFKLSNLVQSCSHYEQEIQRRMYQEAVSVSARQLQLATTAMDQSLQQLELSTKALELGEKQSQFAKESKGFSWIMMLYVSPIALTASIFSMEPKVLPFIRPTVGWFFGLIGIFELLGIVVHAVWSCQWRKMDGDTQRYGGFWKSLLGCVRTRNLSRDVESSSGN